MSKFRWVVLLSALWVGGFVFATPEPGPVPDPSPEDLGRARLAWHAHRLAKAFNPVLIWSRAAREGALSGRRIGLSAGHGIYFRLTDDNGNPFNQWTFQRGITAETREDIHTNQIAIDFLIPMLERTGAEVVTMRERALPTPELLLDSDDPSVYAETGAWEASSTPGFNNGTYRFAYTNGAPASARWAFEVPESGEYPVYAYFLSSDNRARDTHWRIEHADGATDRYLDQGALKPQSGFSSADPPSSETVGSANARWHYLGRFPFRAGEPGAVVLTNDGTNPQQVVIADAVRVGAFESGVLEGGETSGRPRWEEAAMPFLKDAGAPSWVRANDVTARPLYALYEGVDAYFALHTNCCGGDGTSMYTWYPDMWVSQSQWPANWAANNLPPGTIEWATSIHQSVIARLQANWSGWNNRGQLGADFGELRPLKNAWAGDVADGVAAPLIVPGALLEAAFHDTANPGDAWAIREMNWRHDLARAILIGMLRHFNGPNAVVPPLAPKSIAATSYERGVRVQWQPLEDPLEPSATPTGYRVYVSPDGAAFGAHPFLEVGASTTAVDLPTAPCETVYVRVTATNDAGESLDSPVVGATQRASGEPRVLWVNGDDRPIKTVYDPPKSMNAAPLIGAAIEASAAGAGAFAIATDDAVGAGLVALSDYDAVIWSVGETSRRDGSISAEQRQALADYLNQGGSALLSGAEIGWDLIDAPSGDSAAFLPVVMGASYLSDDAESTQVEPVAGGPLEGLGTIDFGLCNSDSYCVEWPDILGLADADGQALLYYAGTTAAAAVMRPNGPGVSITLGFPLESVADPGKRRVLVGELVSLMVPSFGVAVCVYDEEPDPEADASDTSSTPDTALTDTSLGPDTAATSGADAAPTGGAEDTSGVEDASAQDTEGALPPATATNSQEDCACQVSTKKATSGGWAWLGVLALWVLRRRRRSSVEFTSGAGWRGLAQGCGSRRGGFGRVRRRGVCP